MEIKNIGTDIPLNQCSSNSAPTEKAYKEDVGVKDNATQKKEVKVNPKELKSAVDVANKVLFKNNTHLKFEIHEKTKEVMVRIIEDETGEVLKEIPPKKMMDMVAKLWEIAGIIVDEKR